MKIKKTKVLIAIICITQILMSSCKEENILTDNFTINYSKNSSWINYSYKATIDQNSKLTINENSELTNLHRTTIYSVSKSDITILKSELKSMEMIDISNEYGFTSQNAPTDLPIIKLNYKTTEKADSTSIYFPTENEMPVQLNAFLVKIESLIMKTDTLKKY